MDLKTTKSVKQLFIMLIGLITVAGIMLVAYPLFTQSQKFSQEIALAKSAESDALGKLQVLQKYKERIPEVEKIDTEMLTQFPTSADTPGLVNVVSKAAADASLPIGNINNLTTGIPTLVAASQTSVDPNADPAAAPAPAPTPGETGGISNVAEMTVEISAKGSIAQLNSFVASLSNSPRNLLISTYAISSDKGEGEATVTVSAKTYIYKGIVSPEQAQQQAEVAPEENAAETPPAADVPASDAPAAS